MKKFLMPLLALALTATAAAAQDAPPQGGPGQNGPRPTPEAMAARQTEGLTKQLALSPDQSAKVQQILLARSQEMMAMRGQMQAGADRSHRLYLALLLLLAASYSVAWVEINYWGYNYLKEYF